VARVVLERVVKKFGPVEAVDDLTLEIAEREFVTLVGPSGCGRLRLVPKPACRPNF
jgi:ABC-type sugar transport system ATPase subunit